MIEIGTTGDDGDCVYLVRDNRVGFDLADAEKVFEVFERLYRPED
jgi:light-regulated signal transduction histidine kinase (bacteriophytochrome)